MRLYLLRHADAESPRTTDAARELTSEGKRQAETVGACCRRLGLRPDVLLASPYRRTVQTAEAVAAALEDVEVKTEGFLASGMNPEAAYAGLQAYGWAGSMMLVGHQPDIGELAASLLGLNDAGGMPVGKATLIGMTVDRFAPYAGSLDFFLPVEAM